MNFAMETMVGLYPAARGSWDIQASVDTSKTETITGTCYPSS